MWRDSTTAAHLTVLEVRGNSFFSPCEDIRDPVGERRGSLQPFLCFHLKEHGWEGSRTVAAQTVTTTNGRASIHGRLGVIAETEGGLCYLLSEWVLVWGETRLSWALLQHPTPSFMWVLPLQQDPLVSCGIKLNQAKIGDASSATMDPQPCWDASCLPIPPSCPKVWKAIFRRGRRRSRSERRDHVALSTSSP